jgi:acetate kinase
MKVLVLNAGSATLKFQIIEVGTHANSYSWQLARGIVDRFGDSASLTFESGDIRLSTTEAVPTHEAALGQVVAWLDEGADGDPVAGGTAGVDAIGHRVVHGGELFRDAVRIDPSVRAAIARASELAPLHNPYNLACIEAAITRFGDTIPQVAAFDTAFHATLPEHAFLYAIPWELYERHRIRRYGFHGISHRYVAERYRLITSSTESERLVSLHLGNGASACAIAGGESIDTSMGFTPLEGLVMGTRSGDVDAAIVEYLARTEGLGTKEIDVILNRRSGLLGLSGRSNDMRDLLDAAETDPAGRAAIAIRVFAWRARKYVGAYLAALGGADAVLFTGGIGENASKVRAMICESFEWAGLGIDPVRNEMAVGGTEMRISTDNSTLAAWVIPTDEELMIARDTARVIGAAGRG